MERINKNEKFESIDRQGIHLYDYEVIYKGWLIVPVYKGQNFYTSLGLDPDGEIYLQSKHCSSIETAISAGKDLANQIIRHGANK